MARRATSIEEIRKHGKPVLLLDNGNMLPVYGGRESVLKSNTMFEAMNLMKYDAANLGETDISYPREIANVLFSSAGFPILSSNIRLKGTGNNPGKPYMVFNKNDIRIGVMGVAEKERTIKSVNYGDTEDYEISEPFQTLENNLRDVKNKVDLLIMLNQGDKTFSVELAERLPFIDIIICRDAVDEKEIKLKKGNTVILKTGIKGQYIGKAEVKFNESGGIKEINSAYIKLEKSIAPDKSVEKMIRKYEEDVSTLRINTLNNQEEIKKEERVYVGAETCKDCHMEIWTSWSKTSHAKAYETLVKKGNAREKECLYCHTTDFSGDMNKEFLKGVQCEACHGMGDNHLKDELKMRQYGQIQQYRCKRCHIPSRDKDFDYERDKLKSH